MIGTLSEDAGQHQVVPSSSDGYLGRIMARSRTHIWPATSTSSPSGSTGAARKAAASCSSASCNQPSPSTRRRTSRWSRPPDYPDLATPISQGLLSEGKANLLESPIVEPKPRLRLFPS